MFEYMYGELCRVRNKNYALLGHIDFPLQGCVDPLPSLHVFFVLTKGQLCGHKFTIIWLENGQWPAVISVSGCRYCTTCTYATYVD